MSKGRNAKQRRKAGKGRPTPSRREAQGRRDPASAPTTQRESLRRGKQTGGSREERRADDDRRARGRADGEGVLRARDQGPVRAHVRDLVDSRAHLLGLFAPLAVAGVVVTLSSDREVTGIAQLVALGVLAAMVLEGVLLGVRVTGQVRATFPDDATTAVSLGWYAFIRAAQIRMLRAPTARVRRGDRLA